MIHMNNPADFPVRLFEHAGDDTRGERKQDGRGTEEDCGRPDCRQAGAGSGRGFGFSVGRTGQHRAGGA